MEIHGPSTIALDPSEAVLSRAESVRLRGNFYFSRGQRRQTDSVLLHDRRTENFSRLILNSQIGFEKVAARLSTIDPKMRITKWPDHVPYRIKSGQDLGGRENVFLAFPYAVDRNAKDFSEVFGLEFVDFTEQIFSRIVIPSVRRVFVNSREIIHELARLPIATSIYLYAVIHEVAHYMGPWSFALPTSSQDFESLSASELGADEIAFHALHELRPVLLTQLLMRLFWYLPKGEPETDNDVAVSYYYLDELWKQNLLSETTNGGWTLNYENIGVRSIETPDFKTIERSFFNSASVHEATRKTAERILRETSELPRTLV